MEHSASIIPYITQNVQNGLVSGESDGQRSEEVSTASTTASRGSASKFGILGALISTIAALTIVTLVIFGTFPGSEIISVVFAVQIAFMIIGIIGVTRTRSWGYPVSTASLLFVLIFSSDQVLDSFFRPASDTMFFIISMIVIVAPIVSIPFGIQGFRETRGKIATAKGGNGYIRFLAIIALGFALGGSVIAVIASTSPGGASVSLTGPPDVTQTIRMENGLFDTPEITVSVVENVLLIIENIDPALHDFNVEGLDIFVENAAGQTSVVAFTAEQSGNFPFFCTVPGHREGGMEGIIRIQA